MWQIVYDCLQCIVTDHDSFWLAIQRKIWSEIQRVIKWLIRFISQSLWMCDLSWGNAKNNRLRNEETKRVKRVFFFKAEAKDKFRHHKMVFRNQKSSKMIVDAMFLFKSFIIQSCYQAGFETQRKMISLRFKSCLVNESIWQVCQKHSILKTISIMSRSESYG